MANIPKKVTDRFIQTIPKFQKVLAIAKNRDVNESDTAAVLNDILGEVFGYDKYLEDTSEFAIRGTFCDLAIKIDNKVQFLIEVKAVGIELKENHLRQAIDYGANHGAQWVVLTNGLDWRLYKIRFEQPINFDQVVSFNFGALSPRDEKCHEVLFLLSKEGLPKNARDEYYDKVQSINRYVVGNMLLAEPVIALVRRELKRMAAGLKIETEDVEQIIKNDVLKREIIEGDQAAAGAAKVNKFYRKVAAPRRIKKQGANIETSEPVGDTESLGDNHIK